MISLPISMIAIAGVSCSGKTVLARYLSDKFGANRSVVIAIDSYYRDLSKLSQQKKGFAIEINGLKDFCVEKESRRKHWKCMEQQNRKTEEHARCLDLVESYFNDTH